METQNTHPPMSQTTLATNDATIELPVVIQLKDGTSAKSPSTVNEARVLVGGNEEKNCKASHRS